MLITGSYKAIPQFFSWFKLVQLPVVLITLLIIFPKWSWSFPSFCLFFYISCFLPSLTLLASTFPFSLLLSSLHLQYGGGCSELRQLWRSGPVLHWQAEQTHCVGSTRQQARHFQPLLWLFPSCKNPALLLFSWLCLTSINSGLEVICVLLRDNSEARTYIFL